MLHGIPMLLCKLQSTTKKLSSSALAKFKNETTFKTVSSERRRCIYNTQLKNLIFFKKQTIILSHIN